MHRNNNGVITCSEIIGRVFEFYAVTIVANKIFSDRNIKIGRIFFHRVIIQRIIKSKSIG